MAGKFGPASAWIYVDGYDLAASKVNSLSYKDVSPTADTTGIGDTFRANAPIGVVQSEMTVQGGFWDTTALRSHAALGTLPSGPQATARVVTLGFAGQTAGEEFVGYEGAFQADYEVVASQGDLTKANATFAMSGTRSRGQIIQALASKTATWNTESTAVDGSSRIQQAIPITSSGVANPGLITTTKPHGYATGQVVVIAGHSGSTPSINGQQTITVVSTTTFTLDGVNITVGGTGGTVVAANSLNGGVGFMQVTAWSGLTSLDLKLRDSADNISFADLITFSQNTAAPDSERVTVAGTIDRYVAVSGTIVGSGSLSVFCGLARN